MFFKPRDKRKPYGANFNVAAEVLEVREMMAASLGVWMTQAEIKSLPTTGAAWQGLVSAANKSSNPNLADQNSNDDQYTLAKALVGFRTGNETLMAQARDHIMRAIGTESGSETLALGRNLASYVIAADIVGLSSSDDSTFRSFLSTVIRKNLAGRTLISTFEQRPNNWGTMAGGSLAAVAVYLKDDTLLTRVAQVYKGWLGDRGSYAGFKYGDLSWQANRSSPVGINPLGSKLLINGVYRSVDGALPEELRRGGGLQWPPKKTGYVYEALQGAIVTAEILHKRGFDVYNWQDKALLRAYTWVNNVAGWKAEGDDLWQINIVNKRYGTNFATSQTANHGKIMGWTSWTHQ